MSWRNHTTRVTPELNAEELASKWLSELDSLFSGGKCSVRDLVKIGPTVVEPLMVVLEYGNSSMRDRAAEALGQIGDRRAVEPLIRVLNRNDRSHVIAVATALGQLKDERAVESLCQWIDHRPGNDDKTEALAVAEALNSIGDARAIPALLVLLAELSHGRPRHEASDRVRGMIVRFGANAVPPLTHALRSNDRHRGSDIRLTAIETLATLGNSALANALSELDEPEVIAWTLQYVSDEDLIKLKEKPKDNLIRCLTSSDSSIRTYAAEVLGRLGPHEAVPALVAMLENGLEKEMIAASNALGRLQDPRADSAIKSLVKRLKDRESRAVAAAALRTLGWVPCTSEDRIAHAIALGDWASAAAEGPFASEPLLSELKIASPSEREKLGSALRGLGCKPASAEERACLAVAVHDFEAAIAEKTAGVVQLLKYLQSSRPAWTVSDWYDPTMDADMEIWESAANALLSALGSCLPLLDEELLRDLESLGNLEYCWTDTLDFNQDVVRVKTFVNCGSIRQVAKQELQNRAMNRKELADLRGAKSKTASDPSRLQPNAHIVAECTCGTKYRVPATLVGKRAKCLKCQTVFTVSR